jgi:glutamate-1-semialdehyde 2,1-aminomutase
VLIQISLKLPQKIQRVRQINVPHFGFVAPTEGILTARNVNAVLKCREYVSNNMQSYPRAAEILKRNERYLPGGVVSINRLTNPSIVFTGAHGAHMWDIDGNRFIDYHAAFAAHLLGHNDNHVTEAVVRVLREDDSLYGAGTTILEGQLAEMITDCAPFLEAVEIMNTGSEATYQAMRLARAATGRDHFIVIQGGYNGWHNDVSCNLMTPLAQLGPRKSSGEYPFHPISAGIPKEHQHLIHPVNFNDLESVAYVASQYPIAGLITEPILQNIGILHPHPTYLSGLRDIANRCGFILIFDEVKTGFRHALGGYASICGVNPDLAVYGKAIANGYPIGVIGGKRELLDLFVHPDPARRVLLAGTYNGHPVTTAAAIATIERLRSDGGSIYVRLESMGAFLEEGIASAFHNAGIPVTISRQGSALCIYFMDHEPADWHDLASNHNFAADEQLRRELISRGSYVFPLANKQWSISAAHSEDDLQNTIHALNEVLEAGVLLKSGIPSQTESFARRNP